LSQRELNPIDLAYDPVSARRVPQLTAGACNRLDQYASSPSNSGRLSHRPKSTAWDIILFEALWASKN